MNSPPSIPYWLASVCPSSLYFVSSSAGSAKSENLSLTRVALEAPWSSYGCSKMEEPSE